jgi:hypothetical protein
MFDHFTRHPQSVDETYMEHMGVASSFGFRMIGAGCACLVHAILPFACIKTGSLAITELHERMVTKRNRHAAAPVDGRMVSGAGD